MTRKEACETLKIKDLVPDKPVDYNKIIKKFEKRFEENCFKNLGSSLFDVQSRILIAKESLMKDWPKELNVTKFDSDGQKGREKSAAENSEQDQAAAAKGRKSKKNKKKEKQPSEHKR